MSLIDRGSTFALACLTARSGIYKKFGDSLRAYPDTVVDNVQDFEALGSKYNVAIPSREFVTNLYMAVRNGQRGDCKVTVSKPIAMFQPSALPLAKNSIYTAAISARLQNLWENGLLKKVQDDRLLDVDRYLVQNEGSKRTLGALSLKVSSAFFVLGVGSVASKIVLLLEIAIHRIRRP